MPGFGFDIFRYNPLMGGIAFDPDAQAFITAASITDPTQQSAVNQLVLHLKGYSLWTKGSVILPYLGGNATAHRVNLKTATNGITFSGGVTHNSNGVTYNGTTGYGSVNFQTTVANQYNRSIFQYIRTQSTLDGTSWQGAFNGTNAFGFQNTSQSTYRLLSVGLNNLASPNLSINYGLLGVTVTANNSSKAYNGSTVKTTNNTPNATPNSNEACYSGALNNSGSPILYSGSNVAFEFYGDGLTDTDVSNLNTAVQTFQTTLGRNV